MDKHTHTIHLDSEFQPIDQRSWVRILVSPKEYYSEEKILEASSVSRLAHKSTDPGRNHHM